MTWMTANLHRNLVPLSLTQFKYQSFVLILRGKHTGKELQLGEGGHVQTSPDPPIPATFTCRENRAFPHDYSCRGITFPPCLAPQASSVSLLLAAMDQQSPF